MSPAFKADDLKICNGELVFRPRRWKSAATGCRRGAISFCGSRLWSVLPITTSSWIRSIRASGKCQSLKRHYSKSTAVCFP